MFKFASKLSVLAIIGLAAAVTSCGGDGADDPYEDLPQAKSTVKYLKKKKFINGSFSDKYDLYIEFVNDTIYRYFALRPGSETDTVTNNGRNCSFLREYRVNESGDLLIFDGPKEKWIAGAYHTPLSAEIDRDRDELNLTLHLTYHKASPKTRELLFHKY